MATAHLISPQVLYVGRGNNCTVISDLLLTKHRAPAPSTIHNHKADLNAWVQDTNIPSKSDHHNRQLQISMLTQAPGVRLHVMLISSRSFMPVCVIRRQHTQYNLRKSPAQMGACLISSTAIQISSYPCW
jgi:hypothetical protein